MRPAREGVLVAKCGNEAFCCSKSMEITALRQMRPARLGVFVAKCGNEAFCCSKSKEIAVLRQNAAGIKKPRKGTSAVLV